MIEKMEDEGSVITIRPLKKVEEDRLEKDVTKLRSLYEEGYDCAKQVLSAYLE